MSLPIGRMRSSPSDSFRSASAFRQLRLDRRLGFFIAGRFRGDEAILQHARAVELFDFQQHFLADEVVAVRDSDTLCGRDCRPADRPACVAGGVPWRTGSSGNRPEFVAWLVISCSTISVPSLSRCVLTSSVRSSVPTSISRYTLNSIRLVGLDVEVDAHRLLAVERVLQSDLEREFELARRPPVETCLAAARSSSDRA